MYLTLPAAFAALFTPALPRGIRIVTVTSILAVTLARRVVLTVTAV